MHLSHLKAAQQSYHDAPGELQQWSALSKAMTELNWMAAHHINLNADVTPDLEVHPDYGLRVDREATLRRRRLAQDQANAAAAAQPITATIE